MLKKVEDTAAPGCKGLNTNLNVLSVTREYSPNLMDVKVNYDGSIEKRLGTNTQNATVLATSGPLTFSQNSTGTLTTSLIAFWKMDEASGTRFDKYNKNNLSDQNSTSFSGGIRNQAANFVSANSNYLLLNNTGSITTIGNFSYSAWIYLNSTNATLQQTIVAKRDVYDPTLLLLHFDGANLATTFTDNSVYKRNVSSSSNATISTAQAKFGAASCLFDGNSAALIVPISSDFDYGGKDFSYDLWVYPNTVAAGTRHVWSQGSDTTNYMSIIMEGSALNFYAISNNIVLANIIGGSVGTGAWTHLECTRSGATFNAFVGGVSVGTATSVSTLPNSALVSPTIGRFIQAGVALYYNGYIDEFRASRIARHTANFTVPTSAYTVGSNDLIISGNLYEHWLFVDTNNQVVFNVSSSGLFTNGSVSASSFGALTTSTWYNTVGWLDSSNGVIGVSVNLSINTASYTSGIISASAPLVIGAISNGATAFMNGRIDEVGYWKKALTGGERTDLYNLGTASTLDNSFSSDTWALYDFGASSLRWLTVAAGTGLYASSNLGVTFVNIATDRSATWQYLERSKNVLVCTSEAYDNPLYWAGSSGTFAALLNVSAPLCKYSINHQGYLILLNSNTRKRGFFYQDENTQLTGGFNGVLTSGGNFDLPSSFDDEITAVFILRRYLYVSTRYTLWRISYVGGNPVWNFLKVKDWGFIPRTVKKITLASQQPGMMMYSIGEVAIGLTWDRKLRIFDGSGDQILSNNIEQDNRLSEFAINKIGYLGSGPIASFSETDTNQNVYKLCVAIGANSQRTTHMLNFDARSFAFYPYQNMQFNAMAMAESANQRFLMAVDQTGYCHMLDSGNLDSNTTAVNDTFDTPFLFQKSPSQSTKSHQMDLFFSNLTCGRIYYFDRNENSDFKLRESWIISGSDQRNFFYKSIDIPQTYNVYQGRITTSSGITTPYRLQRYDDFVSPLGIGKND